ncbi:hypothetical protein A1OE_999 [Candidatus Endolissoclinum faulkneri L2]|uniref:Uncharacterized protein n=1 Tax=Candidatus Endolissoclinum faulkneri L2 TaxID=1193729 RepID=K7YHV9_9PROT|nr:hypothetical protein A1OE_999 [Candidatus Endolissoclinum faulkneri L2]
MNNQSNYKILVQIKPKKNTSLYIYNNLILFNNKIIPELYTSLLITIVVKYMYFTTIVISLLN